MPKKKVARIAFVKAAAGVSFTTLAAIGGATGNPVLAGLSAVPVAGLASYEAIRDQLGWSKTQKENTLEIPIPPWWRQEVSAWQNLCNEVEQHLPSLFQSMQSNMQQEQQVLTREVVQQIFVDTFLSEPLTCITTLEQKRRIGAFLAPFLLQHIEEVLTSVIEQLQREGSLIDTRRIAEHTQKTVQVLEQIHEGMAQASEQLPLSKEENAALYQGYSQTLYARWKMLDFKGIMHFDMNHPISIPLTEVFVFPDVQGGMPDYETHERDTEYVLFLNHLQQQARRTIRQREPLQEALVKHRRLVLLGDPGSGKSTLLRYFLLQLVQGRDTFAATLPLLSDEAACVPFYLQLAAYAEVFLTNAPGTRSLEDFLPIYLRDNYLSDYIDFLQEHLQRGNVVFLFDGLDEIPDAALRIKVVDHIERFTQAHTANRFIVTSRIVGYKEAPLSTSEYQIYTLADFNKEQIKTFTQRWCPSYERWVNGFSESQHLEDAATREAQKLFDATQSQPAVKRLAVNPLLLTILALIQRQGIDLPSHRIELYRLCTETLIDTWVKARGQSIQFSKNELIRILRPLAFWMHEHAAIGAIPQEELHEQIVRQLVERTLNTYEAQQQAEQFLQIVRGKTGILVERGKERYGFLHLTFEEYFTARAVELLRKDRETFIKKRLHNPRWREVIFLTVGSVGIIQNDEEQVTELIRAIVQTNSPYEWALHRDLLFAGHCLADDIGVLPSYENELLQRILFFYLTSPHEGFRTASSKVLTAWRGTRIADKAAQLVLPVIQQWTTTTGTKKALLARSSFEKNVAMHIEDLTRQQQSKLASALHFDITIILAALQMLDHVDWQAYLVGIFTDEEVKSQVNALLPTDHDQQALIVALIAGLADPNAEVRRKILNALEGLLQQCKVSEAIYSTLSNAALLALSDTDVSVRQSASALLVQIGKERPSIVDALLASLERELENEHVKKQEVIDILGNIGEGRPAVVNMLLSALAGEDNQFVRAAAASALANVSQGGSYVTDALLMALADHEEYVVDKAISSLGRIYEKKYSSDWSIFSPVLSELTTIADPGVDVLQVTAKALGKLSSDPSKTTAYLSSSFFNVQKVLEIAIQLLGYLGKGHPCVPDTLITIVLDAKTTHKARREAVNALELLDEKDPHVINTLLSILSGPFDQSMKVAATKALGQLGKSQSQVIEALLHVISDTHSDSGTKNAAANALGWLGASQPRVLDALLSELSTSPWFLKTNILKALACLVEENEPRIIQEVLSAYKEQPRLINALLFAFSAMDIHMRIPVMSFFERHGKDQPILIEVLLIALTEQNRFTQKNAHDLLIHLCKIYPHHLHNLISALSHTNLIQEATQEYRSSLFGITTARAIDVLGEINSEHSESVEALFTALNDDAPNVGRMAAKVLVQLCRRNVNHLERLVHTLSEIPLFTRQSAILAFSQWNEKEGRQIVIDLLLSWLSDEIFLVRYQALRGLERVGKNQARVIEPLLLMLSDPSSEVRGEVARILGSVGKGHPQVINALLQTFSDRAEQVRYDAVIALGKIGEGQPRIIEALTQAILTPSFLVRHRVYITLRDLGQEQPQISEILFAELSSPDYTLRAAAARTFGFLEDKQPRIISALLPLLSDASWRVRSATVAALGTSYDKQTGIVDIVDALLPMLNDPSSSVRQGTASAFSTLIRENEDIRSIRALLQATYDPDRRVRDAAALALAKTQSDSVSIGKRIEELLQQTEKESGYSVSIFNALRDIAEKTEL